MPELSPVLDSLLGSVIVCPRGGVSVRGRLLTGRSTARKTALRRLQRALYEQFHAGRLSTGGGEPYPDEGFRDTLTGAVRVRWVLDPGWTIVPGAADGGLRVEKDGLRLLVDPRRHLPARGPSSDGATVSISGPSSDGATVSIRLPAERPGLSPGFFAIVSAAGAPRAEVVRFYCNLTARSAPPFVAAVGDRLHESGARWALKTLADPLAYGRRDGTVVYAEASRSGELAALVERALDDLPEPAREDIPPLSLALTPTIGFAEEPDEGGAVSFGQHRMDVIARSLLASRAASERERRRQLAATLLDARIDPSAPYRNWRGPGIGSRRAEGSIA